VTANPHRARSENSPKSFRRLRLALLSDIHGNAWALRAVLDDAARFRPDAYVVLGDLLADGPAPSETLKMLRELLRATLVRGNTDRYLSDLTSIESGHADMADKLATWEWGLARIGEEGRRYLEDLPHTASVYTPSGCLLAAHAVPGDDEGWIDLESPETVDTHGAAALLVGHSHAPYVLRTPTGMVINPGSVGLSPITDWRASWAVIDAIQGGHLWVRHRQVAWDTAAFVRACETNGMPVDAKLRPTIEALRSRAR